MKKSFYNRSRTKKQRGVAIVFTLGILGLLTVIALGFASTALLNRKLSENVMLSSYAGNLARNMVLQRVLHFMNYAETHFPNTDYKKFYSYNEDLAADKDKDWLLKLDTTLAGVEIFKYEPSQAADKPQNDVRWQYIYDDPTDANKKIIGRYAFVVVPDKGRIDPSVNVSVNTSAGYQGIGAENPKSATNLDLKALEQTFGYNVFNEAVDAATRNSKFRYMTFKELRDKDSSLMTEDAFLKKGINVSVTKKSPEAYLKDDGKFYARFNMMRSDWASLLPKDLCGEGKTESEYHAVASQEYIPWLKKMYAANPAQALQIAANIIQYNLADTDATVTDATKSSDTLKNWLVESPTVVGIGRHPMLNEVGFRVLIKATVDAEQESADPESWKYTPKYLVTIQSGAELVYPFGKPENMKPAKVKFTEDAISLQFQEFDFSGNTINSGSPVWTSKDLKGQTVDLSLNIAADKWIADPAYTAFDSFWSGSSEVTAELDSFSLAGGNQADAIRAEMLKNATVKLNPTKAVLVYGDDVESLQNQKDYAELNTAEQTLKLSSEIATRDIGGQNYDCILTSVCFETKDPLVNHVAANWTIANMDEVNKYESEDAAALNKIYPGSVFSDDGAADGTHTNKTLAATDPEPAFSVGAAEDKRMPASFIRHAQMRSFWELAAISRGEAWKTLNLMKKNPTDSANPDDYTYEKGDAALFDELKFTDEKAVFGKININTDVHEVLEKLLIPEIVPMRKNPLKFDSGNDVWVSGEDATGELSVKAGCTTKDPANCLICALLDVTESYKLQNRADLLLAHADLPAAGGTVDVSKWNAMQTLLLKGSTDQEKMQIASKIMPVLRATAIDSAYVVILVQSIKDVGGNIPVFVNWDGTSTEAINDNDKALEKAGFKRPGGAALFSSVALANDCSTNAFGTYDLGADKITGESRLIATLVRDPVTKKWTIARVQYGD